MSNETPKQKIVLEVLPEWREIVRLAEQMEVGQIIIKIQDNEVILSEYTIKRKPNSKDPFTTFPLI